MRPQGGSSCRKLAHPQQAADTLQLLHVQPPSRKGDCQHQLHAPRRPNTHHRTHTPGPCTRQVRKLSVTRVLSPLTYDNLSNIVPTGLYDPAMGPIDQHSK
jgi:hypothetical protein